jgi:hypothetical protein
MTPEQFAHLHRYQHSSSRTDLSKLFWTHFNSRVLW